MANRSSRGSTFSRFARRLSVWTGKPATFIGAAGAVLLWALLGPLFDFSDTEAMQIKLDELIRATRDASNALLDLEELDEKTLDAFRDRYEDLAKRAKREPHHLPPKPWDIE